MPPKVKITREDIIKTAVGLVRANGVQAINARDIALELDCSTQPLFSNFASMDELRGAVTEEAEKICAEYMEREVSGGNYPPYKASGMAYIRFAKEESELFKLLYMCGRSQEKQSEENRLFGQMGGMVHTNKGLDMDAARLFHLEMWAYVHGIAVMFATGFLDLEWELVSKMMTDAYQGMRKQYGLR